MRALRWTHIVALEQTSGKWRSVTEVGWDHERFAIHVWRSVRATGDTKTRKSRRTLGLPKRCVRVLCEHQERQAAEQTRAGARWQDRELVFTTATGGQLDKDAVLRAFRKVVTAAGLDPKEWTPCEQRHTFVSVLSDEDVPIDLRSGRPQGPGDHRDRLPAPDPARRAVRCGSDGPHIPRRVVTRLVTHLYIRGHTRGPDMASDLGRGGRI